MAVALRGLPLRTLRCTRRSSARPFSRLHAPLFCAPILAAAHAGERAAPLQLPCLQIHVARFSTASSTATPTKRPIDLASSGFDNLRAKDNAYVDKTSAIVDVLAASQLSRRAFFSRPRRFGKSLTIEVMGQMLAAGTLPAGVKEWPGYEPVDVERLFGGLAVHDRIMKKDPLACSVMEKPYFVIILSLGGAQTGTNLKQTIIERLSDIAGNAFGPQLKANARSRSTPASALEALVRAVPREVPIAVLVDAYDMAITSDVKKQRWSAAEEGVDALRSLMMASKAHDLNHRIQRFIITGVSGYVRTLHSSGANNFIDLTGHPITSRMLGFTEDEIRTVFPSQLEALGRHVARHMHSTALTAEEARDMAMKELDFWHNGYCYDGTTSCYNPTPVLAALKAQRIMSKMMDGSDAQRWLGLPSAVLLDAGGSRKVLTTVQNFDISDLWAQTVHPTSVLLQTGLLTLKPVTQPSAAVALPAMQPPIGGANGPRAAAAEDDVAEVTLQAPNEYARKSLLQLVAHVTTRDIKTLTADVHAVRAALSTRDSKGFGRLLVQLTSMKFSEPAEGSTAVASLGEHRPPPHEVPYHTAIYGFLRAAVPHQLSSVLVEEQSQLGAADIVLRLKPLGGHPEEVWVMEVGAVTPQGDRTTEQLVAQKLEQVKTYYAKYESLPGKVAAVVVNNDMGQVVVKWCEWDVAGFVWKDLPEQ